MFPFLHIVQLFQLMKKMRKQYLEFYGISNLHLELRNSSYGEILHSGDRKHTVFGLCIYLGEKPTSFLHHLKTPEEKNLFLSPAQHLPLYIVLGRDYSEKVQVEFNPEYKIPHVSSFPYSRFI